MRLCTHRLISIHAPARGATRQTSHDYKRPKISIHAPARGATTNWRRCRAKETISIHAPARGATDINVPEVLYTVFQSTLPRGERHNPAIHPRHTADFNPRSREGSDCGVEHQVRGRLISIHAPARGATIMGLWMSTNQEFQSTLPRGERRNYYKSLMAYVLFQSTLPRGERH